VQEFHEARLVKITHGGLAIRLDPFGMLDPEVVVNLLPKLGVRVDFVRYSHWLGDFTQSAALCSLGLIDAALGRKQEALSEGRSAVEFLPI